MPNPAAVAILLFADWYHEKWPLIPKEELYGSAVDFPHEAPDGTRTYTKVLMHKRRISAAVLAGDAPVDVCEDCKAACWSKHPTLSKWSLSFFCG